MRTVVLEQKEVRLNDEESVEKINKNPQCCLRISIMQEDVSPSHKLQDPTYEFENPS